MKNFHICILVALATLTTACNSQSENKKEGTPKTFKSNDGRTAVLLNYRDDGSIITIEVKGPDPAQQVTIGYHSSGQIFFIRFNKGKAEKHVTEYYPNGRPKGLVNLDTSGTGDAIYYFANGQKSAEGHLQEFEETGMWKRYREDGTLLQKDTSGK